MKKLFSYNDHFKMIQLCSDTEIPIAKMHVKN